MFLRGGFPFARRYEAISAISSTFSTSVTPGADHAARSALSFSLHERTAPLNVTQLPSTSTVTGGEFHAVEWLT
jgi:hypothetical protein